MKTRSLFAILLLAIAPVAAVLGWQLYDDLREREERIEDGLKRAAAEFAQAVNRDLGSSIDALAVLSQSEIFQQGRIAAMGRLLQGRPRRDWDSIFLLDPQGTVVLDTAARPTGPDPLRELHAHAMARLGPAVSGAAHQPGIAIAMPILQGGQVRYVLGARMSDAMWPRLAAQASPPFGGQARLYDAQGRLISQALGLAPAGARLPPRALEAMSQQPAGVHRSSEADGTEVIAAWDRVPLAGWHARVFVPAEPVDAAQRAVLVEALSTTGVALVAGLLLAGLAGGAILRRERAPAAAPEPPAAPEWRDEFLTMLTHELRSPLGAISAAADVLESTHPTSGSAADARAVIARQARQLSHLMHELLEASRAMAGRISIVRRPIEMAPLVRHIDETLAFTGEMRQHAVVLELEEGCWVGGDSVRLEQVVTILLIQMARRTPAGSSIRVGLREQAGTIVIEVRAASEHGAAAPQGLAWTLAQALVRLHGGTLEQQAREGEVAFVVRLPAASAHPSPSHLTGVTALHVPDKE